MSYPARAEGLVNSTLLRRQIKYGFIKIFFVLIQQSGPGRIGQIELFNHLQYLKAVNSCKLIIHIKFNLYWIAMHEAI